MFLITLSFIINMINILIDLIIISPYIPFQHNLSTYRFVFLKLLIPSIYFSPV